MNINLEGFPGMCYKCGRKFKRSKLIVIGDYLICSKCLADDQKEDDDEEVVSLSEKDNSNSISEIKKKGFVDVFGLLSNVVEVKSKIKVRLSDEEFEALLRDANKD